AAAAARDAARTEVERLTIRAPIDATVLQVKAKPGAFAPAGQTTSLMVLGCTTPLHVRVDIDENDAWRMRAGATAEGCVRGNPSLRAPLRFVRIEPYVVPKKSLTNDPTERVDTRVLQAVFALDPAALPVYVGQQLDVFIAASGR
ncbi:MAG: HlyD family efflux transporter periplasmic adaptor subunit, partial [Planctomycetes bacterium]|nr:HlyD family efflux transporter periplasmic adaptor subunit [Planctomycetota bacterium]